MWKPSLSAWRVGRIGYQYYFDMWTRRDAKIRRPLRGTHQDNDENSGYSDSGAYASGRADRKYGIERAVHSITVSKQIRFQVKSDSYERMLQNIVSWGLSRGRCVLYSTVCGRPWLSLKYLLF